MNRVVRIKWVWFLIWLNYPCVPSEFHWPALVSGWVGPYKPGCQKVQTIPGKSRKPFRFFFFLNKKLPRRCSCFSMEANKNPLSVSSKKKGQNIYTHCFTPVWGKKRGILEDRLVVLYFRMSEPHNRIWVTLSDLVLLFHGDGKTVTSLLLLTGRSTHSHFFFSQVENKARMVAIKKKKVLQLM